jgi:hyperosmotically inducible periplasmic protein
MTSMLAPFRDAWLAGRVRLALLASGATTGGVSVETYHGRVQLTGDVPNAIDRHEAEQVVHAIPGVVSVSNRIRVRGAVTAGTPATDADIQTAVSRALAAARALRGSRIGIGVYDGVVTLSGSARGESARVAAFEIAVQVPGVRRVVSDVAVSSTVDVGRRADAA